jgi:hypothetical protein
MDEKETNIHEPNGIPSKTVGHVDKDSRIYQDGREIGYVDRDKQVHVPDDIFYRGKVVGQIKNENKAYSKDEFMVQSKEWGYVDEDGNIRQKDSGRIVGKMRGDNRAGALGYYMLRFKNLEERVDQLEQSVYSDSNKVKYLDPVRKMLDYVPNANALGDFDILISRLRRLEGEIISAQAERRYKKEELCRRAEFLSNSTDWKATHVALVELQEKWKEIGFTGKEFEDTLWRRFRSAQDKFYQRRQAYFEELNRKREENRKKKEVLCSEAESLSTSTDWKATSERMKELQAQWKEIGSAGRKYEDDLWRRFRSAQDRFFERRNSFYEKFKSELKENLRRKERLCESAESLTSSNDLKSAKEEIKVLQAEWKEIGHVPREYVENLWQRFRKACDEVFERAREEYERKHAEWRSNLQDAIERKRQQIKNLSESVAHDEGLVERWQDTINNLYDGGKADEIRDSLESKISDVEDKIRSKESRISELQDAIQDMESKLR